MNHNSRLGFFVSFLTGTIVGGVAGFLFAPKTGQQLREDLKEDLDSYIKKVKDAGNKIVEDAQNTANQMVGKANQLIALLDKYIGEDFKDSLDKIENEISIVKAAINTAIDTYKSNSAKSENSSESIADDIFIDFVNENSEEDEEEIMPLHEGMKRRHDKKYF
ncbi:MAG: YtxH domain-containing protein [Ignavibacteriaceae bacterium]